MFIKKNIKILFFSFLFIFSDKLVYGSEQDFDVTVVGSAKFADGRGRLSIGFIDYFKDKLSINYLPTMNPDFMDLNDDVKNIILDKNKTPGKVAILFDPLYPNNVSHMPNSIIKIAYSTFEATKIPDYWVKAINEKIDSVVVPSQVLVDIYKKSGVKKPVFFMPHGIYIEEFLNEPIKRNKNRPFVFGSSAGFWEHKNHELLLRAFIMKFENNPDVKLKLHGRIAEKHIIDRIFNIIKERNIQNIEIILKKLSREEYLEFMKSLDCYVIVSKGEGFSVTPREAAALGIPTIISNNLAHTELARTPYFKPVRSDIAERSNFYKNFGCDCGFCFNTDQYELENALEDVYNNYDLYLERANLAREWVKQYTYPALEKKYFSMLKPKNVILGDKNIIDDNYLMTDSKELYEKYMLIKDNFDSSKAG